VAVPISVPGDPASPLLYTVPGSTAFITRAASATFDGSGAAGSFLPTMTWRAQNGDVIGRYIAPVVAAGASAEVSWFPWRRMTTAGACPPPAAVSGVGVHLLGTGTASGGADLTIPISHCPCFEGVLYVIAADASIDFTKFGAPLVWTISDTTGVGYSPVALLNLTPYASISNVDDGALGSAVTGLNIGPSAQRAVTAALPITTADTITIGWEPGYAAGEPFASCGVALLVSGINDTAVGDNATGGGVSYANGDSYPGNLTSPDLSWVVDYGGTLTPNPVQDAVMLAAIAGYPDATPWTPLAGVKVAELSSPFSLVVTAQMVQPKNTDIDPGGFWGGGPPTTVVGNYQFAQVA
jgi:hypothetical protein